MGGGGGAENMIPDLKRAECMRCPRQFSGVKGACKRLSDNGNFTMKVLGGGGSLKRSHTYCRSVMVGPGQSPLVRHFGYLLCHYPSCVCSKMCATWIFLMLKLSLPILQSNERIELMFRTMSVRQPNSSMADRLSFQALAQPSPTPICRVGLRWAWPVGGGVWHNKYSRDKCQNTVTSETPNTSRQAVPENVRRTPAACVERRLDFCLRTSTSVLSNTQHESSRNVCTQFYQLVTLAQLQKVQDEKVLRGIYAAATLAHKRQLK